MGKAKTPAAEPAEPAKPGRPTKFKPEFVAQAVKLAALGATDREVAEFFEVEERTLYRWKHEHEAFCQALKVGKASADERVEQALYRRAVGYVQDDTHFSAYEGAVTQTPYVKVVPPDTTAAIFWLKNRKPEEWRDMKAQEISGPNGAPLEVHQMTDRVAALPAEKRAAVRAALKAAIGDAQP